MGCLVGFGISYDPSLIEADLNMPMLMNKTLSNIAVDEEKRYFGKNIG
ncbi:MAG: hypothetical protein HXX81_04200 [Campylobacterales bacterium]|nr:hypothetical protein [Campylobacterales bacterium]